MRYEICAHYDERVIRVYQAFRPEIAKAALDAQRFVPPFKMERMTWIKPSFYWMMYRSGFAQKTGQECILAIDILREGFEWALEHAALSNYNALYGSHEVWRAALEQTDVRIQWDPEENWRLESLDDIRSIQIGLSGEASRKYVNEWTTKISDVTPEAVQAFTDKELSRQPDYSPAKLERLYPLPDTIRKIITPVL